MQIINAMQIISAMLIINIEVQRYGTKLAKKLNWINKNFLQTGRYVTVIQSVFQFLFSVMLNNRSILFFMADWVNRPALKWTLKMGQFTMWSLIWESLGSLFFFFTKLNSVLNSSSCSSCQWNRPVNLFFFASEKKKQNEVAISYLQKFPTTKPY